MLEHPGGVDRPQPERKSAMTNFTPADVPHEYDPDEISTFVVRAKTTFSQVPRWILRAGNDLSHGAVRLYGVIMSYADNDNRSAFPSQQTLMNDMGAARAKHQELHEGT
jgi:G3E family GTPase